jgi:choline dehydrogenase
MRLPFIGRHTGPDPLDHARHAFIAGHLDRRQFLALAVAFGFGVQNARADLDHAARVRDNQRLRSRQLLPAYDYIVCGSGTAGSTLAGRLVELTQARVLLLEAGGSDQVPSVFTPGVWFTNLGTALDWQDVAEPTPYLNGRAMPMDTGRVLGGGSSINACNYSRGHRNDFEFWAAATGDDAWNYESTLAVYRRLENWQGTTPDPVRRGRGGPVWVQPAAQPNPCAAAMVDAAQAAGIPRFADINGEMMEGPGGTALLDQIIEDGRRRNMPASFLYPVMDRPNFTVLTGALIDRVEIQHGRAVGVQFRWQGKVHRIGARHEVVLSAGGLRTPQLMMLSGIGNEGDLRALGIPVVRHAPEVGLNLQDHVLLGGCVWEYREPLPLTNSGADSAFFVKSRPEIDTPDLYPVHIQLPYVSPVIGKRYAPPEACWSIAPGLVRPKSRGQVRLRSADVQDRPIVEANHLAEADDVRALVRGVELSREIGNSAAMKDFVKREVLPGPLSGPALESFVRDAATTFFHPSGTCRMGQDDAAVTDAQLRVRGVQGLRIADSSVMPRITTGAPMAPCMVIGERLAQLLIKST